ncbi:HNH endonuclease signature motif containing protein [Sphingomonas sp.]|uniref:HNH endonuclease signature motif containing protein n=1 Tax=Sphingomonas sp. TaxID=28214 RepID=UPI00341C110F
MPGRHKPEKVATRFWAKVDRRPGQGPRGTCWNWSAAVGSRGYGNFGWKAGRSVNAHKAAYLLTKGDVPDGMVVMHSCDNRRCCNPAHLSVGTYSDNTQDGIRKGRIAVCAPGRQAIHA